MPIHASVLLLTYNQSAFVEDALQSLLNQDYDNLEIVISDDNSQDQTWEIINSIANSYLGNKKIVLNKNPFNLGIVGNYYKAFELSKGQVIFTAAGDDISLPNRCSACIQLWLDKNQDVDLIAADGFDMNLDGSIAGVKQTDVLETWTFASWLIKRPFIFGASHMLTRKLLNLRTLTPRLNVEDQCLVARALMMGGALRCPNVLVKHRRGGVSQTKRQWTYALKRKKLIESTQYAAIECEEISNDAQLLGINVDTWVADQKNIHLFELEALSASNSIYKILLLFKYPTISARKKWKLISFSILKPIYTAIYTIKSKRGR